jgi:hypothetical protein
MSLGWIRGSSRGHHCGGAGLVGWPHDASAAIDLPAGDGYGMLRTLSGLPSFGARFAAPAACVGKPVAAGLVAVVRTFWASLRPLPREDPDGGGGPSVDGGRSSVAGRRPGRARTGAPGEARTASTNTQARAQLALSARMPVVGRRRR